MVNTADLRAAHAAVEREDWPAAWRAGNKALNDDPDCPEALYLTGCALRALGNVGLALPVLSKALARAQQQPNLWMTYAATLHDLNRWDEAEQAFRRVHGFFPADPMPMANIGATYVQRGKWRDAITWCDRALRIDSSNHIARVSKGFACLALGRWQEAWGYCEALYGNHLPVRIYGEPGLAEPMWDGTPGQTVVVQCDQGLGDIIMFAQCLSRLISDCKQVIIECAGRMTGLLKRNFPQAHVYGTLKDAAVDWTGDYKIDARVHMSHLGRFYLNRDRDFERKAYLTPDSTMLLRWLDWLEQFPRPWTGITWKGGIQVTQAHLRSIEIDDLEPVLNGNGTFFDLSHHDSAREVATWNNKLGNQIVIPPLDSNVYDDTVAFIEALDRVVTITTSVAHVCGALGRSAHVLVPEVAQWRYAYHCDGGTHMIWYQRDSVRLYRRKPGETDWAPAINRLSKDMPCAS